jgi:succinate-acetate transporter protein
MNLGDSKHRFGIWWLAFGYTLALHVLDEAGHDFLSVYNPNALLLRRFLPFFPVFTFRQWIGSLLCALTVWLALAPLALHGLTWQRRLAIPVAVLAGIGNALGHILSSIYLHRFMPGVFSAPLILLSGIMLLRSALGWKRGVAAEGA